MTSRISLIRKKLGNVDLTPGQMLMLCSNNLDDLVRIFNQDFESVNGDVQLYLPAGLDLNYRNIIQPASQNQQALKMILDGQGLPTKIIVSKFPGESSAKVPFLVTLVGGDYVTTFVLKIPKRPGADPIDESEFWLMRTLSGQGISSDELTSMPYYFSDNLVLYEEFIPGKNAYLLVKEKSSGAYLAVGNLDARLWNFFKPLGGFRVCDNHLGNIVINGNTSKYVDLPASQLVGASFEEYFRNCLFRENSMTPRILDPSEYIRGFRTVHPFDSEQMAAYLREQPGRPSSNDNKIIREIYFNQVIEVLTKPLPF